MARLDELLQREPPGPARDVLTRLSGQPAAPAAAPQGRTPIDVTELPPPTSRADAVKQATAVGAPHAVAVTAAVETEADDAPGFSNFWTNLARALPMLLGGPGAFASTLTGQNIGGVRQAQEQSARDRIVASRSRGLQALKARLDQGESPRTATVRLIQDPEFSALFAEDPEFMATVQKLLTEPPPEAFAATPGTTFGTRDPNTGQVTVQGRTDYAPQHPLVSIDNKGEAAGKVAMAQTDAKRVGGLQDDQRALREQAQAVETMSRLIETGAAKTGGVPAALTTYVRDRFGIDLGQSGGLQAFQAAAQSQALAAAGQLKGSLSDKDVTFLQSLSGNVARSPQANAAVLGVQKSLLERRQRELDLEQQWYYDHGGTLAGFDQWIRTDAATEKLGPAIPDSVIAKVQASDAQDRASEAKTGADLVRAIESGEKAAVNAAIVALGADGVKALPQSVRDKARAILESAPAPAQTAPVPPKGSGASREVLDLLGTFGAQ
jgi:hypothetical protein